MVNIVVHVKKDVYKLLIKKATDGNIPAENHGKFVEIYIKDHGIRVLEKEVEDASLVAPAEEPKAIY